MKKKIKFGLGHTAKSGSPFEILKPRLHVKKIKKIKKKCENLIKPNAFHIKFKYLNLYTYVYTYGFFT